MNPIGGYFSLELIQGASYHPEALALNTGRNCLEYILRVRRYNKVYIPYYTCGVVLEPLQKLDVDFDYYHINQQLELEEEISLKDGEALLYTNYFGFKQSYIKQISRRYGNQLIVDNTQAFYAEPIGGVDTFYTCRKFFGVPDGAYLYTDAKFNGELEQVISYDRMSFLLKRLDLGAEAGYADFREQTERLIGQPIKRMSQLTQSMMQGIDYDTVAMRRRSNFNQINRCLSITNQLHLPLEDKAIPMIYPYLTDDTTLKNRLIEEKVFVPTYWPNVLEWCRSNDWEYKLAERTVFIPIDQRYDQDDMQRIIDIIKN